MMSPFAGVTKEDSQRVKIVKRCTGKNGNCVSNPPSKGLVYVVGSRGWWLDQWNNFGSGIYQSTYFTHYDL